MMRRLHRFCAVLVALAAIAAAEPAAAVELPFTGGFEFQLFRYPPIEIAAGGIAEASTNPGGQITRIDMPAGVFSAGQLVIPVTDPAAAPVRGYLVRDFGNETGVFQRGVEDAIAGSMPLRGLIKLCLFGSCSAAVANLTVPASVIGHDASAQRTAAINLTIRGAPWTTGPIEATPDPVTGSDGGLELNLVTPLFISTNIAPSAVVRPHAVFSFAFGSVGDHCQNQLDDDGDGVADFPDDPGCASADDPSERTEGAPCDNGIDDDGDLRIDGIDPGCSGPLDASERSSALVCDDDIDNDGDGAADQDDAGCSTPSDPSERGSIACDDGLDTDGDGFADQLDPGCTSAVDASEREVGLVCDDGIDDDRDGVSDFPTDPGCASIQDPSERTASLPCDDGVDNDGDGRNDFSLVLVTADAGCSSPDDPSEKSPALACDDDLDNDFDGHRDVPDDPGCLTPADESEQALALPCDNGLDDDGDGAIDSQQDAGCTAPSDPREAIDFADGGYFGIGAAEPQHDDVFVSDGAFHVTALDVLAGGAIAGDLTAAGSSFVRVRGGDIEGSLVAQDHAEVELLGGAIAGTIEAHDTAMITIFGSGFDLPLGIVTATSGMLAGFLADGSAFTWEFVRDPGAAIVLVPEPGAGVAALVALGALLSLRRRAPR